MPTAGTDHEQVNRTKIHRLVKRALKEKKAGQETEKVCDVR